MQHHQPRLEDTFLTRREFLCRCGMGMGALSLATFFGGVEGLAASARAEEAGSAACSPSPGRSASVRLVSFDKFSFVLIANSFSKWRQNTQTPGQWQGTPLKIRLLGIQLKRSFTHKLRQGRRTEKAQGKRKGTRSKD